MRIAGNYTFDATREEVWSAINDPEVLARAIPGCQHLDQVGENEYETTLKVGLQAVRGVYHGRVKIGAIVAPVSYEIHVDGKGSNGFLNGTGVIKLREDGNGAILDYGGEAHIGGTIASVGQRLIDGAAKTLINQSLKALAALIETRRSGGLAPIALGGVATPAPVESPLAAVIAPVSVAVADSEPPPASRAVVVPVSVAVAEPEPPPVPSFERRKIVVPAHEQLSEAAVARGAIEDFFKQQPPWLPWVVVAFLIGYILGRQK